MPPSEYAGVEYGLTPVVSSATLGNCIPPPPTPRSLPPGGWIGGRPGPGAGDVWSYMNSVGVGRGGMLSRRGNAPRPGPEAMLGIGGGMLSGCEGGGGC